MKKLLVFALAVSVMLTVAGFAQDMSKDSGMSKGPAAPLKNLKGTVKADGDKLTFVSDKDSKAWDIVNPEAVKGHEGHHVELSAHVYADKGQIHVMSVKMLKAEKMDKMDNMSKSQSGQRKYRGRQRPPFFFILTNTSAAGTTAYRWQDCSHQSDVTDTFWYFSLSSPNPWECLSLRR